MLRLSAPAAQNTVAVFLWQRYVNQPSKDPYETETHLAFHREYDLMAAAAYFNKLSVIKVKSSNPNCLRTLIGSFGNLYVLAVIGGHHEAVEFLFSTVHKYDIESHKNMVVYDACRKGSIEMVKKILPNWTKRALEKKRSESMDKLQLALQTPSVEIFEMIMHIKETTVFPKLSRHRQRWLLGVAVRNCWLDMVRHLLPLIAPKDTHKVLFQACQYGHPVAVQLLLDHGAEMQGCEIGVAAYGGRWEVVRLLVR
jgi:hypothetical protein